MPSLETAKPSEHARKITLSLSPESVKIETFNSPATPATRATSASAVSSVTLDASAPSYAKTELKTWVHLLHQMSERTPLPSLYKSPKLPAPSSPSLPSSSSTSLPTTLTTSKSVGAAPSTPTAITSQPVVQPVQPIPQPINNNIPVVVNNIPQPQVPSPNLIRQGYNTCYMDTCLQMIANDPELKKEMREAHPSIDTIFKAYDRNQLNNDIWTRGFLWWTSPLKALCQAAGLQFGRQEDSVALLEYCSMAPNEAQPISTLTATVSIKQEYRSSPNGALLAHSDTILPKKPMEIPHRLTIPQCPEAQDLQTLFDQSLITQLEAAEGLDRKNYPVVDQALNEIHMSQDTYPNVAALKTTSYLTFPKSLFISINRFQFVQNKHQWLQEKTHTQLDNTEHLQLPNADPLAPPQSYTLKSFNVHLGAGPQNGHYIAYVRRGDRYYLCDDQRPQVVELTRADFLNASKDAYILNYRLDERPPAPP